MNRGLNMINKICKQTLANYVILFMIILDLISYINLVLYNTYGLFFLYLNLAFIIVILAIHKLNKTDFKLIISTLVYLIYSLVLIFINQSGLGSIIIVPYSFMVIMIF